MEKPQWQTLESQYVIDTPFLRIRRDAVRLPNGTVVPEYFVRESAGFVIVFALTHDERLLLVRQYRYGNDSIGLELPAGMLEPGEEPESCARRELVEETGYEARELRLLATYAAEAVRSDARAYIFTARGARKVAEPRLDATEHLEVELVTVEAFESMLLDGRVDALSTVAAGYRALADRMSVR